MSAAPPAQQPAADRAAPVDAPADGRARSTGRGPAVRPSRWLRRPLQIGAFGRKEVVDVLRQPKLLLTLVFGPFLILAAFGIGYNDSPDPLRTVFVASSADSPFLQQVEEYADRLGDFVDVRGTSTDYTAATRMLQRDDVDLVVVFPDDAVDAVMEGQQSSIQVIHTRLDPIERTAILFASDLAVGEINSAVLSRVVAEGQEGARIAVTNLDRTLTQLAEEDEDVAARLDEFSAFTQAALAELDRITEVDPNVVTQPFESDVRLLVDRIPNVTDWYAPAAVMLMLQQFGVAFGSLTFVRERQLGIVDVFRVAPVGATEALLGKYLAYLVLGMTVGAALMALVVAVIGTPLAGTPGQVAAVMALSLFASIGLGLIISLASRTDAQAVQYTMIILLGSLFFSGFFLSVGQMEHLARWIGWLLPVTYGMAMLRDVMLRGSDLDPALVAGLAGYGVVAFLLALIGTRRRMSAVDKA